MTKITFLPNKQSFKFKQGISILNFAKEHGIDIPSQCEEGTCYTCVCEIQKGQNHLFENINGDIFKINDTAKSILACVTELKDSSLDDEIIINLGDS